MQSQRTAVVVSLIIGLAIGVALLMVLWACAICFSKSRTKDDDQHGVHAGAQRNEQGHHPDAVATVPDESRTLSKVREVLLRSIFASATAERHANVSVFALAPVLMCQCWCNGTSNTAIVRKPLQMLNILSHSPISCLLDNTVLEVWLAGTAAAMSCTSASLTRTAGTGQISGKSPV